MNVEAGSFLEPGLDLWRFVGGVVVHHEVQVPFRVGAVELPEEREELLPAMLGFDRSGDVSGRDV
jgi:hypothetical protein